ncbi:MAG: formylglycine-generating enzyme family protein [Desulfobulbaceae bacterium]|nr:formylglycine-generating enzyme family protein [Desulfobulbaceae bacterium]HIJ89565.1 formylglycine-generating enzyme family protein [Deltaproteobacteria bacterium]
MKNILSFTRIFRCAVLLILLAMPGTASSLQIDAEHWSEDALLHDGRIIKVTRKVDSTLEAGFKTPFIVPHPYIESSPDRFRLNFEHPDSKEKITWQGEQYFNPVMLDIVEGVPYLVVVGRPHIDNTKKKIIDNDKFPYMFLKYQSGGWGKWVEIPVEQFPTILLDANLSPDYPVFSKVIPGGQEEAIIERKTGRPFRDLSVDNVLTKIKDKERSSQRYFQSKIPRSYEIWNKAKKLQAPRQPQSYEKLPPPQEVALEILETKDYTPARVLSDDEMSYFISNKDTSCNSSIKEPKEWKDQGLGEFFANDLTGQKQVPYNKFQATRLCEGDSIWFMSNKEQREKIVLTKYTTSGDLLYRISFQEPESVPHSFSGVVPTSFRSEKGSLYFAWRYNKFGRTNYVRRLLAARLLEPKINAPIAPDERNNGQSPAGKQSPPHSYERLSPPQEVALEILKTTDYAVEWPMDNDEFARLAIDEKSGPGCSKLFKWANLGDTSLGHRFVLDPTGLKQVPYGEFAASRICGEEGVWFLALREQPGKLVLTKYTTSGDFLYRISFQKPEDLSGYAGAMDTSSLHSENGYLYFDWRYYGPHERLRHVAKRNLKIRIFEPKANVPIAPGERNNGHFPPSRKSMPKLNQPGPQAESESFRDCPTCPEMVVIPGKKYAIGKYEVTQAEWDMVMDNHAHDAHDSWTIPKNDRPVTRVDWEQVQQYISQLNNITGQNYRLPTESEWEHACYGGKQTAYCGGNDIEDVAWWGGEGLHSVGQKRPNGYGLYDMTGNVWEWVDDCWKGNCEIRVIRGGSFLESPLRIPEAYRYGKKSAGQDIGFRLFRTLPTGAK